MKELLDYLRARLGPDVDYETPPTRLSGGFDTTTMAFTLSGAPPEYGGGLILRVMPRPDTAVRVRREAATHAALIGAGFPAPRILVAETDPAVLGKPFLIMQRLAGDTLWASAVGPNGRLGRIAGMSRTLAEAHVLLHGVPGEALRDRARQVGIDEELVTLRGEIRRLETRIERAGLVGLMPGIRWLEANLPPPAQPEVICHGDFHPLNIMMDDDRLSGVIDWPQAISAEPAYDVASSCVLIRFGDMGLSAPLRWLADAARVVPRRRYLAFYRALRPLETGNMPYFEGLRVLSALIYAGERPPGPGNPWGAPHTLTALYRHFEKVSGLRVRLERHTTSP